MSNTTSITRPDRQGSASHSECDAAGARDGDDGAGASADRGSPNSRCFSIEGKLTNEIRRWTLLFSRDSVGLHIRTFPIQLEAADISKKKDTRRLQPWGYRMPNDSRDVQLRGQDSQSPRLRESSLIARRGSLEPGRQDSGILGIRSFRTPRGRLPGYLSMLISLYISCIWPLH